MLCRYYSTYKRKRTKQSQVGFHCFFRLSIPVMLWCFSGYYHSLYLHINIALIWGYVINSLRGAIVLQSSVYPALPPPWVETVEAEVVEAEVVEAVIVILPLVLKTVRAAWRDFILLLKCLHKHLNTVGVGILRNDLVKP